MVEDGGRKICSFKDLNAWKNAHNLALKIYQITKKFPADEIYSLTSQMRRAVISIASNIAEGFSRKTKKDKIHFYIMSLGSLTELQSQIEISRDLHYLNEGDYFELNEKTIVVHKLINGLIKSLSEK